MPRSRDGAPPSASASFGEPEVQHLDRAVRSDLDVGGLEIAVDDALLVRGFERFGDLPRDRQCLVERDRPARDALRERRSLDQLQHERASSRRPLPAVDARRCSGDSATRAFALPAGIGRRASGSRDEGVRQDLDRHIATELRIVRAIDLAHAPGAEERRNLVGTQPRARS